MKLGRFNPANIRVRDQRGSGGGGMFPGGGGGKLGCGGIVVVLAIAWFTGADPLALLGGMQQMQGPVTEQQQGGSTTEESCALNDYSIEACSALDSLNQTWQPRFQAAGIAFEQPILNFYSRAGNSGCGMAQSTMGPFYCPPDHGIYIDTQFYDEMARSMGAAGDFARLYVMAHEYGHHVQNLTGVADQVQRLKQRDPARANAMQVRMELQADCYAGVWAAQNRALIEPGDIEEGMRAAYAVGDDTLMRSAGRAPVEEAFTHGSSEQRMEWLRIGLETGNEDRCDTFGTR